MAATPEVDPNAHIKEYLDYYIAFPHAPHFAVMLTGAWGIGKTYLVKKFLDQRCGPETGGYVYISLFGISSVDEIDGAILAGIYPMLGTKTFKWTGRVAMTALKAFGVDPELKAGEFLKKAQTGVFVFDDVERCDLPVNIVLGYLNAFTEHNDGKVILIANEQEIGNQTEYLRRREKLIGKSLQVQSSFFEALDHFTRLIEDDFAKAMYVNRAEVISEIYHQADLNNLRILQQTMWDFERVVKVLTTNHRESDEAMSMLLRLFFALSFEVKAGRLMAGDLRSRMTAYFSLKSKKDEEPLPMQVAARRYADTALDNSILSDQLLVETLMMGVVDETAIRKSLDQSPFFTSGKDEAEWRVVWHGLDRDEGDFGRALAELERKFAAREYSISGEILHVFGLRLWLADVRVLPKNRKAVAVECRDYVDDLYAKGRLEPRLQDASEDLRFDGYGGLGIHEASTSDYRKLYEHLTSRRTRAAVDAYPEHGRQLLADMKQDPDLFVRKLCYTNSKDNIFPRVPVLAAIDVGEFVETLFLQRPAEQRKIASAFGARYEHGQLGKDLREELTWVRGVRQRMLQASKSMSSIRKFQVKKLVEWYLDPALSQMKKASAATGKAKS